VLALRLSVATILQICVFAVLLFAPAGTLGWTRAWILLGGLLVGTIVAVARLWPEHRGILEERLRPPLRKDQPRADKVLSPILMATFVASIATSPLDLFRLHLLPPAELPVVVLGGALVVAGFWLMMRALEHNAFAAAPMTYQAWRGHDVARSGPYAFVRHPMYAGGILFFFGLPLWLGSYAGALAAIVPSAAIIVRIFVEERFLQRNLPGYEEYALRVRYRLLPRVF
jgi:protein-S-isoprenylcysteine O-methyltransferase Ste14